MIDEILSLLTMSGRVKSYAPAILPKSIERGDIGKCFDWCAVQALKHRQYRYVEGVARKLGTDTWILHAWLTDGMHAFDPTWLAFDRRKNEKPVPFEYLGIEMDIMDVARFMKITGYQGVLANRWRNKALADKCLQKVML